MSYPICARSLLRLDTFARPGVLPLARSAGPALVGAFFVVGDDAWVEGAFGVDCGYLAPHRLDILLLGIKSLSAITIDIFVVVHVQ